MGQHLTIPIQPLDAATAAPGAKAPSGCGACLHGDAAPVCRSVLGEPCAAATLSGPAPELQRLLQALAPRLGFAPGAPEQAGVCGLHVQPGEVELQLALPACGEGARLAETAFDTLRGLLPNTDIYVTHRA